MKKTICITLILLMFYVLSASEEMKGFLEKKELFFGEKNHLLLDKKLEGDVVVNFKSESDKFVLSKPFKNKDAKWEITVTALDYGDMKTPEVLINNHGKTYNIGAFAFKVKPNKDEKDNKFSDMWGMVEHRVKTYMILYIIAGLLIVLLVIFIILKLKKRKKEFAGDKMKELTSKEVAAIYIKYAEDNYKKGCEDGYIDSISMGVKFYLGKRFNYNIPEMTTGELRRYIKKNLDDESVFNEIVFVMKSCDSFKFAGARVEKDIYDSLIDKFKLVVNKMEPKEDDNAVSKS